MVDVIIYVDQDATSETAQFDVAPRTGETLMWRSSTDPSDRVYRVSNVRHERQGIGFKYVIGITAA